MAIWMKRFGILLAVGAIAAAFYLAMRAKPVAVDIAIVEKRPMSVTIDEEGVTRVRDVYTVSSPIAGHLDRITLDEGQAVEANKTVVASIHPLDPPFLDERTRTELAAAAEAARSAIALAKVEHQRAEMSFKLADSEYQRADKLAKRKIVPLSELEKAFSNMQVQKAQVASAEAAIRLREAELASAEARLQQPGDVNQPASANEDCCVHITAPVDGVVLKIIARSEQAVTPGTRVAEIGDPAKLEVVVDLLSSDAAKISPGARAVITEWGGKNDLVGTVRRIDPAAFTKVSSLGIEEQRVNAIIDLEEVPPALGHGYRVLARLGIWQNDNALQVPIGALFRSGGEWSVFVVAEGLASLRRVNIGQMNSSFAEVVEGLSEGEAVVLYPNDTLEDGSKVEERRLPPT